MIVILLPYIIVKYASFTLHKILLNIFLIIMVWLLTEKNRNIPHFCNTNKSFIGVFDWQILTIAIYFWRTSRNIIIFRYNVKLLVAMELWKAGILSILILSFFTHTPWGFLFYDSQECGGHTHCFWMALEYISYSYLKGTDK